MEGSITFDELWDEMKNQSEEAKDFFGVAETVSDIINDIVRARVSRGWSQRDLAKVSGVKQSAIARMERLQAIPRLDTLVKVAQKLNIKICAQPVLSFANETETVSIQTSVTVAPQTVKYRNRSHTVISFPKSGGVGTHKGVG